MKRFLHFIRLCIVLRSVSRALWVDAYDNFKPKYLP